MPYTKTTCGTLYLDAISAYKPGSKEYWAFARGFVNGEAEKCCLGACKASMFRPSAPNLEKLREVAIEASLRYGLEMLHDQSAGEVWLVRPEAVPELEDALVMPANTPESHRARGALCGVPEDEVDEKFHERQGYGEKCD